MIGHRLNGCIIVAAAPSTMDAYTILAAAIPDHPDRPGHRYVTGTVYVNQIPEPTCWHNGHYFMELEAAIVGFFERAQTDRLRHPAMAIEQVAQALRATEYPKTVMTVTVASYEDAGAQYTLIYPDGKKVLLGDAEDNYAELAGIIDDEYEKEGA